MNRDALMAGLETQTFGRQIYPFAETDSTNTIALQLGYQGEPEGSLVLAEFQRSGRGRRGREWLAPPQSSILASLVLRYSPTQWMQIDGEPSVLAEASETWYTVITALAVVKSIHLVCKLKAQVKWPNDVWIGEQKVCGILTETAVDQSGSSFCVIGFGINVNFSGDSIPLSIRQTATALNLLAGDDISREQLLQHVLFQMEKRTWELRHRGTEQLMQELRTHSMVLHRRVCVETPQGRICGEVCDFAPDASLLIRQDNLHVTQVHTGDLCFLD